MATEVPPEASWDTVAVFEWGGPPLATAEVADRLTIGRRRTDDRLDRLDDRRRLDTKTVGASAGAGACRGRRRPATGRGPASTVDITK